METRERLNDILDILQEQLDGDQLHLLHEIAFLFLHQEAAMRFKAESSEHRHF